VWMLEAVRGSDVPLTEETNRQGTAWRRARSLFAAGFTVTATQFSVDDPPQPLATYRFDGIRFVPVSSQFPTSKAPQGDTQHHYPPSQHP
jgi:hypothetical protein